MPMYGKQTLAQTGAATGTLVGVKVLGVDVPVWALAAALLVTGGALMLRLSHKLKTRSQR